MTRAHYYEVDALLLCYRGAVPLESWLFVLRCDGTERRFMSSPDLLLVRLPSPAANCPTRDLGSEPVLRRLYVLHKHSLPPLSSPPFVADH